MGVGFGWYCGLVRLRWGGCDVFGFLLVVPGVVGLDAGVGGEAGGQLRLGGREV